jgi:GNAT superfamily N-acetyltransferase
MSKLSSMSLDAADRARIRKIQGEMKVTKIRPFTLDDAEAVVDLMNAQSRSQFGENDSDLDEMIVDWTTPGLDLAESTRVVESENGDIIGYAEVWDISKPHVTKYAWAVLHPELWDDDIFNAMLRWVEKNARGRIALAPEDTRVVIKHGLASVDQQRKKALEANGYQKVRAFLRMVIDLEKAPSAPVIPAGLQIVPIDLDTELEKAVRAMEDGFADHWGHVARPVEELLAEWRHHIENNKDFDPSVWFLAKDGDEIAGVCRCSNKTVEDPDMGWVNQLCVLKAWRRQGLGMALLKHAFGEFHRRGKKRAGLGVDSTSLTNATRLYEKAGMQMDRQYDTYEFELRKGKDLSTK